MDELDVFRALAHPVRRKIVNATLDGTQTFYELQRLVRRGNAALAGHLRILREARILEAARQGREIRYHTNRRALRSGAAWLSSVVESPAQGRGAKVAG